MRQWPDEAILNIKILNTLHCVNIAVRPLEVPSEGWEHLMYGGREALKKAFADVEENYGPD